MDHNLTPFGPSPETVNSVDRRAAIAHHMEALEELADSATRADGWTPFARKLFLRMLAENGRVTHACDCVSLSKQSAYALRARDPIFAAGWDAACELARIPLADALYEQALDGTTETITRDDGRTVTRHRFDTRLSIAVLSRLDRRCDRAAERGAQHLRAVRRWDEYVGAVGLDDGDAARAILAPGQAASQGQPSQLPADDDPLGQDDRLWWDEEAGEWRTDFPPPADFDGAETGTFGGFRYSRSLAEDELDLIERAYGTEDEDRAADEEARDAWFAALKESLEEEQDEEEDSSTRHPGLGPCPEPSRRAGPAFSPETTTNEVDLGSRAGATSDSLLIDATDPDPGVKSSPPP